MQEITWKRILELNKMDISPLQFQFVLTDPTDEQGDICFRVKEVIAIQGKKLLSGIPMTVIGLLLAQNKFMYRRCDMTELEVLGLIAACLGVWCLRWKIPHLCRYTTYSLSMCQYARCSCGKGISIEEAFSKGIKIYEHGRWAA